MSIVLETRNLGLSVGTPLELAFEFIALCPQFAIACVQFIEQCIFVLSL